jgi:RimJ/RimL family protein N-acetyltransferase
LITGEHIILRGLELTDVDEILKHWNDVELRRFLGPTIPVSKEEEEQWIRNTWEQRRQGTEHVFGIEIKKPKRLIGTCSLFDISRINRSAELGIAIWNKQYWGKGHGQEAINLLLGYGFNFLNLHTIFLLVNEDNPRAIRAYEKVGFQHAARHRKAIFQNGIYKDVFIMDILDEEFRKKHPADYPLIREETKNA